jgi:hypothetical protein
MKKAFFGYIFLLIPFISISQLNFYPPVNIQVTKVPTFSESFNQGLQNGLAIRNARASEANARTAVANAQSDALKNNYEKIEIDFLKGMPGRFKSVAIKKVTGWAVIENYETLFTEIMNGSKYQLVNEAGKILNMNSYQKNKLFFPPIIEGYDNDSLTLFLEWSREATSDYDRISRLILKSYDGSTVYQAEFKNKSYTEILRPVLAEYIMTSEEAKINLIKLKEYLDLGLISQSEFDSKATSLKKILINF